VFKNYIGFFNMIFLIGNDFCASEELVRSRIKPNSVLHHEFAPVEKDQSIARIAW